MYLGDCAALSFLQHIQELIEGEKELATVAADVADFPVYEEMPPGRDNGLPSFYSIQLQDIQDLIEVFFTSVRLSPLEPLSEEMLHIDHRARRVASWI